MGALLEPLSVAIHAFRRASLNSKSRPKVLVFGAGTIGLLCAAVCRFNEATSTVVADIQSERVDFARLYGFASHTLTVPTNDSKSLDEKIEHAQSVARMACDLEERTANGFDVVFECSGQEVCTQAAIYVSLPIRMMIDY